MDKYIEDHTDPLTNTRRAKRQDLALYLEHAMNENAVPMLYDLTRGAVEQFIAARLDAGDAPATVNRRLGSVKHLARTSERMFPDFRNTVGNVHPLNIEPPQPLSFTDGEIDLLRSAARCEPNSFKQARAMLILDLGLYLGLRCAEMCDLVIGSFRDDVVSVRGKGRTFRDLPLHPRVKATLTAYLNERSIVGPPLPHLPLVTASWPRQVRVNRVNEKTVYKIVHDLGEAGGVKGAHPHRLRHTFVRLLLEATNYNLPLVSYAARHANVQTTMRYRTPFRSELTAAFAKMGTDTEPDK
jgi:integrase